MALSLRAIRPLAAAGRGGCRPACACRTPLRSRRAPSRAAATPPPAGAAGAAAPAPPSYANALLAATLSSVIYDLEHRHEGTHLGALNPEDLLRKTLAYPKTYVERITADALEQCKDIEFKEFVPDPKAEKKCWWNAHDTECGIFVSRRLKRVVAAFRGTEPTVQEWLGTNILPAFFQGRNDVLFCKGSKPLSRVHRGWLGAYTNCEISKNVEKHVVDLYNEFSHKGEDPEWGVLTTGHSLGGALATLCTYRLAVCNIVPKGVPIEMVTFAAPRVGNEAFKHELEASPAHLVRLVNNNDIVPRFPPPSLFFREYRHVGPFVKFDGAANAIVYPADRSLRELDPGRFPYGFANGQKRAEFWADHTMSKDGTNSYLKKLMTLNGWPGTPAPP